MGCLSFGAVTAPIALIVLISVPSGSAIAQELDCSRVYLGDLDSDVSTAEAAAERAIREAKGPSRPDRHDPEPRRAGKPRAWSQVGVPGASDTPRQLAFEDDPLVQRLAGEIEEAAAAARQSLASLSEWLRAEVQMLVTGSAAVDDSSSAEARWIVLSEASETLDPGGANANALSAARFILTRQGAATASLVEGLASLMDLGEWESQGGGLAQQWRWRRDNPTGDEVRRRFQGSAGTAKMREIANALGEVERQVNTLQRHGEMLSDLEIALTEIESSIQTKLQEFPYVIDEDQAICYVAGRVPRGDNDARPSWQLGRLHEMTSANAEPRVCFFVRSLDPRVLVPDEQGVEGDLAVVEIAEAGRPWWNDLEPEHIEGVRREASINAVDRAWWPVWSLAESNEERDEVLTLIDYLRSVAGDGASEARLKDAADAQEAVGVVWQSWETSKAAAERLEGRIKALEALR